MTRLAKFHHFGNIISFLELHIYYLAKLCAVTVMNNQIFFLKIEPSGHSGRESPTSPSCKAYINKDQNCFFEASPKRNTESHKQLLLIDVAHTFE